MPRDNRVLSRGRPDAVLEAVTGVPLEASALFTMVTGCLTSPPSDPARGFGEEWRVMPAGPDEVYLNREKAGPWRVVAMERRSAANGWRAEYRNFEDGLARSIRLVSTSRGAFDLQFGLSQVELNMPLGPEVFRVQVPASASPITLDELKRRVHSARMAASRSIACRAFAKINLDLRVLGVRPDGYHELRTTFQSIALADDLTFTASPGPFRIVCDDPECPTDARNLVWRAAELVWKAARRRGAPRDVVVTIAKRIPMQAGLGGGSSDAAAALGSLAALWRIKLGRARRHRMAVALGADVPYFLEGGTALGRDRGDRLSRLPDRPRAWVVVVVPRFGVSTKDAFAWWDRDGRAGQGVISNDLQAVVARRHPVVSRLVAALERQGAFHASLSGSGSAVFGLFTRRSAAERAARALRRANSRRPVLVTRTLGRREWRELAAK